MVYRRILNKVYKRHGERFVSTARNGLENDQRKQWTLKRIQQLYDEENKEYKSI